MFETLFGAGRGLIDRRLRSKGIDEQFMLYPARAQFDPGSIWLRKLMLQTGRELERSRRKAA
jgi:hypothetical protein